LWKPAVVFDAHNSARSAARECLTVKRTPVPFAKWEVAIMAVLAVVVASDLVLLLSRSALVFTLHLSEIAVVLVFVLTVSRFWKILKSGWLPPQ
jgi:hypothetical protein